MSWKPGVDRPMSGATHRIDYMSNSQNDLDIAKIQVAILQMEEDMRTWCPSSREVWAE